MSDQNLNRDKIWKNILADERLPKQDNDRNKAWLRKAFLLLLLCIIGVSLFVYTSSDDQSNDLAIIPSSKDTSSDTSISSQKTVETQSNWSDHTALTPSNDKSLNTPSSRENIKPKDQGISSLKTQQDWKEDFNTENKKTKAINNFDTTYNRMQGATKGDLIDKIVKKVMKPVETVDPSNNEIEHSDISLIDHTLNNKIESEVHSNKSTLTPSYENLQEISSNKREVYTIDFIDRAAVHGVFLTSESTCKIPNDKYTQNPLINNQLDNLESKRPFVLDLAVGVGLSHAKITNLLADTLGLILNMQDIQFSKVGHLRFGAIYNMNNWQLGAGINLDIYESNFISNQKEIVYQLNSVSKRIEKMQLSTNYSLCQYFTSTMLNLSLAKSFQINKLKIAPRLGFNYAFLNLSRGRLLDGESKLIKLEDHTAFQNPFSMELGLRITTLPIGKMQYYLELGHGRYLSFSIRDEVKLRLNHTSVRVGSVMSL
jgi:hypothetical protein